MLSLHSLKWIKKQRRAHRRRDRYFIRQCSPIGSVRFVLVPVTLIRFIHTHTHTTVCDCRRLPFLFLMNYGNYIRMVHERKFCAMWWATVISLTHSVQRICGLDSSQTSAQPTELLPMIPHNATANWAMFHSKPFFCTHTNSKRYALGWGDRVIAGCLTDAWHWGMHEKIYDAPRKMLAAHE